MTRKTWETGEFRESLVFSCFSFTDCTSFALMESMGLTEASTYDWRDFEAAGFVAVG